MCGGGAGMVGTVEGYVSGRGMAQGRPEAENGKWETCRYARRSAVHIRVRPSVHPSVRRALSCRSSTTHPRGGELTAPPLVNLCELYYILLYALLCQFAHSARFDTPVSRRLICDTVMYIVYIIIYNIGTRRARTPTHYTAGI